MTLRAVENSHISVPGKISATVHVSDCCTTCKIASCEQKRLSGQYMNDDGVLAEIVSATFRQHGLS